MRIAITGGLGFIGKEFTKLFHQDHELIILGRSKFPTLNKPGIQYRSTDYSIKSLRSVLLGIEAVIHLAGNRQKSRNHQLTIDQYLENVVLSSNVFEACRQLGIKNIVNASSRSVYGFLNAEQNPEKNKFHPNYIYGLSKYNIEKLAFYYNSNFEMSIKSLRIASVFGYKDDPDLFNTFMQRAVENEPLIVFGDGNAVIEYLYSKDLANAIKKAISMKNNQFVVNISSGKTISIKSLAENINKSFKSTNQITFIRDMNYSTDTITCPIDQAFTLLGWRPTWSLVDIIEDVKQVYLTEHNPNKTNKN